MRARYLDIAKGLAILCIVLLHFSTGLINPLLNVFIGTFMITMFYVTSGWVDSMKPRAATIGELLRRRWHQLGVPYVAWTAIILLFDAILWAFGYYDTYFMARELYKSLVLRGIGTLWFLPALYGGEVIWWYVRRSRTIWVALIAIVGVQAYMFVYGRYIGSVRTDLLTSIIDAPFRAIDNILMAFVCIMAGFAFGRMASRLRLPERNSWLLAVAGAVIIGVGYWLTMWHPVPFIWFLGAPQVAPLGFIILFMAVETSPLMRYFEYWGRNSMALMVTHFSILMVICDLLTRWITGSKMRGGAPAIIFLCLTMAAEYFIAEWLRKRHPRLIGLKK